MCKQLRGKNRVKAQDKHNIKAQDRTVIRSIKQQLTSIKKTP